MDEVSIIINVNTKEQIHNNGAAGVFIVPPRKANEEFGMLVVFPVCEIQDIGDNRKTTHWPKVRSLAKDIVGVRSDASAHTPGSTGSREKWGLFLCEAEPDIPRELLRAMEAEAHFLNEHRPEVRYKKYKQEDGPEVLAAVNVYDDGVAEQMQKNSDLVKDLKAKFMRECRSLVQRSEIQAAKANLQREDQRLVAEGDMMWARPMEQGNINELHREACKRLGQTRPWCYSPQQLVECPGCGEMIKENILNCSKCGGNLDEGIEKLRTMPPAQRRKAMYPMDEAAAVGAGSTPAKRG